MDNRKVFTTIKTDQGKHIYVYTDGSYDIVEYYESNGKVYRMITSYDIYHDFRNCVNRLVGTL